MHPTISHYLATARAAEMRSQAQRGAMARAARQARTHKLEHAAPRLVRLRAGIWRRAVGA